MTKPPKYKPRISSTLARVAASASIGIPLGMMATLEQAEAGQFWFFIGAPFGVLLFLCAAIDDYFGRKRWRMERLISATEKQG